MACRGVLFAITDVTVDALCAASTDAEVMAIIEALEEEWNEEYLAETDKAWDAIHRALTNGSLDREGGTFPLDRAILGGRQLHRGPNYIVTLVPITEVPEVARALAAITDEEMRNRYERLVPPDYAGHSGDDTDRDYTVAYFREVAELYERAAKARRAVVFTVDQ